MNAVCFITEHISTSNVGQNSSCQCFCRPCPKPQSFKYCSHIYYYVLAISTKALKIHWTLATDWKQNYDSSPNLKEHLAAGPAVPMHTQRQVDLAPYSQDYKHGDGTDFAADVSGPAQLSQRAANFQRVYWRWSKAEWKCLCLLDGAANMLGETPYEVGWWVRNELLIHCKIMQHQDNTETHWIRHNNEK